MRENDSNFFFKFKLVAMTKCVISSNQVSYCAISPKTFGHCASFQKKTQKTGAKHDFFCFLKLKWTTLQLQNAVIAIQNEMLLHIV